ncbi:MAG: ABC transporter permease [Ferruginibacter sp.]
MNTIFTVLKKELTDTLRDKRTLLSAIILPAIVIPLLIFGVTKLQKSLMDKAGEKPIRIALIGVPSTYQNTFNDSKYKLQQNFTVATGSDAIQKDSLDAVVEFQPDFLTKVNDMKSGEVKLYFKSTNLLLYRRIAEKLDSLKAELLKGRIKQLNISEEALMPLVISKQDIASPKEQIGKLVGGFLPYIFILFCFMGCMYPAIDLITGEKEKGTMETLLTVPASRFKILVGKIMAISLVGLCAATMTILGMVIALKLLPNIPKEFLGVLNDMLSLKFVAMLYCMLIPLSIFFAGMLSAMVIRAKSFKEAQSMVTPMTFVIIIPAILATIPGIELNWQTSFIPVLNIALATKEIIAGTINPLQYAVVVVSLIVLALVAAFLSYKQFSKESMVLK